jgi:lipopolysaccharide/colanic/teichoic acid biosynthesis glycosyltransferase
LGRYRFGLPVHANADRANCFRYSRIECLPQLINVLRGEISIIDPDGSSPSLLD